MVALDFSARQICIKVAYWGPPLSGKTENLRHLYGVCPMEPPRNVKKSWPEPSSIGSADGSLLVRFDFVARGAPFGPVRTPGGEFGSKVSAVTAPGGQATRAAWKEVAKDADGIVFVADSARDRLEENRRSLALLRELLGEENRVVENVPIVFQWNRRDGDDLVTPAALAEALAAGNAPAFEAVAARGAGVKESFLEVACRIRQRTGEAL